MTKRAESSAAYPPIEALLPHRGPMLWLTEIVSVEGHDVVCRARVAEASELPIDTGGGALMALELFAQAAAAMFGHRAWVLGLPFEGGALVGARDIQLHREGLASGAPMRVRATERWTVDNLSFLSCRLEGESGELATGTITVAVGRPPEPFG